MSDIFKKKVEENTKNLEIWSLCFALDTFWGQI